MRHLSSLACWRISTFPQVVHYFTNSPCLSELVEYQVKCNHTKMALGGIYVVNCGINDLGTIFRGHLQAFHSILEKGTFLREEEVTGNN